MSRLPSRIELRRFLSATPQGPELTSKDLGLGEEKLISRISRLKKKGIILRMGAFFDSEKLGFKSTLVAMKVPQVRLQEVAKIINHYPGVTHNYGRDHELNLWFVLMGESKKEVDETLRKIKNQTGTNEMLKLPKRTLFKLDLNFTRERE